MSRPSLSWVFLALLSSSCSASEVDVTAMQSESDDVSTEVGVLRATAIPEVRVRVDGLTLWADASALPFYSGGVLQVVIRGRTSSNLNAILSFVPDDAFGTASLVGPRSFEVTLRDGPELNTILSGLPLFLRLDLSNGRTYNASLSLSPRFVRYSGSTAITVAPAISPVYFKDDVSNLRYRGTATVSAPSLTVSTTDGVNPGVKALGGGRFAFDWDYERFAKVFDNPRDPVRLSANSYGMSVSGRAEVELGVEGVQLTSLDPGTAWPSLRCSKRVYDCIAAMPAMTRDFGACGSYREVARCMIADACEFTPPVAFALTEKDASALSPAIHAAHAACPRTGGSWCTVDSGVAFTYPRCLTMESTPEKAIEAALLATDRGGVFDPRYGMTLTRAQLAAAKTFGSSLLSAADAFASDTEVRAVVFESEESCHNCHQFSLKYVLVYLNTRVVIVIDGSHGYDS